MVLIRLQPDPNKKKQEIVLKFTDSEYIELKKLSDRSNLSIEEVLKLLNNFHKCKSEFEEAYKYKDYYPNFVQVKNRYQEAKVRLMEHELFKNYKSAEQKLEDYLMEIEMRLKAVVNIREKHGKINIRLGE